VSDILIDEKESVNKQVMTVLKDNENSPLPER
jgi:hypothetical protein